MMSSKRRTRTETLQESLLNVCLQHHLLDDIERVGEPDFKTQITVTISTKKRNVVLDILQFVPKSATGTTMYSVSDSLPVELWQIVFVYLPRPETFVFLKQEVDPLRWVHLAYWTKLATKLLERQKLRRKWNKSIYESILEGYWARGEKERFRQLLMDHASDSEGCLQSVT
jgi:hypothetical protein